MLQVYSADFTCIMIVKYTTHSLNISSAEQMVSLFVPVCYRYFSMLVITGPDVEWTFCRVKTSVNVSCSTDVTLYSNQQTYRL